MKRRTDEEDRPTLASYLYVAGVAILDWCVQPRLFAGCLKDRCPAEQPGTKADAVQDDRVGRNRGADAASRTATSVQRHGLTQAQAADER